MLRKAANLGLKFRDQAELDGNLAGASVRNSYGEFAYGAYSMVSSRTYRQMDGPPKIDDKGTHIHVNETVDASVFEYWRTGGYKSWVVENWAKKKGIDPAAITTSVRADDPNIVVSD
jgi:hypothetical protein